MEVLPDIVGPEPLVVFCGLAGAESTKTRDHYYETPGNNFWESLAPERLLAAAAAAGGGRHAVVELGLGLTDLVGSLGPAVGARWTSCVQKVARWQPEWVAFTSKNVALEASRALGASRAAGAGRAGLVRRPRLGVRAPGHERGQPAARLRRPPEPRCPGGATCLVRPSLVPRP